MHPDIEEVLFDAATIQARVQALGEAIVRDYDARPLVAVCILRGAFMFAADLVRQVKLPIDIDFMAISSYGSGTKSSGAVRILKDLDADVEGRDVLIIEDIVDTGLTLDYLLGMLRSRRPASLRACVLLDKPERRLLPIRPDYVGFTIPDRFVVGYGLDYAGRYRNLPYVGVLRPSVYRGRSDGERLEG
ncbi:MAG TPA: hypoxanthine phosphoribosyltransferase [Limnochordia bacterium]